MIRIVIAAGEGDDMQRRAAAWRRERDRRNPYLKYITCTCGRLCEHPVRVIMLSNGNMVNICNHCQALLERAQRNLLQHDDKDDDGYFTGPEKAGA